MFISDFFSVPVTCVQLPNNITEEEIQFLEIKEKEVENHEGTKLTIDKHILDDTKLSRLRKEIKTLTNEYFQKVFKPGKNIELEITESWLSITEMGGYQTKHNHPDSVISGIINVQMDPNDYFTFHNPQKNIIMDNIKKISDKPIREYTKWTSESWVMGEFDDDKNRKLVLLPSFVHQEIEKREIKVHDFEIKKRINLCFKTKMQKKLGK